VSHHEFCFCGGGDDDQTFPEDECHTTSPVFVKEETTTKPFPVEDECPTTSPAFVEEETTTNPFPIPDESTPISALYGAPLWTKSTPFVALYGDPLWTKCTSYQEKMPNRRRVLREAARQRMVDGRSRLNADDATLNNSNLMPILTQENAQLLEDVRQNDSAMLMPVLSQQMEEEVDGNINAWWNTLDPSTVRTINHKWNRNCRHCGTPLLTGETSSYCCGSGKYTLQKLPELPNEMRDVYENAEFSHLSRKLNALFTFTAIGVDGHFVNFHGGVSSVVVQGRIYHRILPRQTANSPLRWMLYDASERDQAARDRNLDQEVVAQINAALTSVNPFIHHLRRLKEDTNDNRALILQSDTNGEEIAAIMSIDNTTVIDPRAVVIHFYTDEQPTFINSLNRLYEPLQYPLLFPHGTPGWSPAEELTQMWFYRLRLLQEARFEIAGRLTNEYIVDMFSRIEEARLNYLRNNQPDANEDEVLAADGGPRPQNIYLPTSFLGGKRWCSEQTADALAIVKAKGKPSFFVTETTNPNWPEIKSKLRPGQNYADIPLVVVRAFHQRVKKLKKFIREKFGRVVYMVCVTEFQKRGLPHAHIAVKVEPEPLTPAEIDKVVMAEVPRENGKLRTLVLAHMVHNHGSRCKKEDGSCQYKYPQKITRETSIDGRGYVKYRRSELEDVNIVPYNPHLLLLMESHINVEIASTVNLIMYLYKYFFKGGGFCKNLQLLTRKERMNLLMK